MRLVRLLGVTAAVVLAAGAGAASAAWFAAARTIEREVRAWADESHAGYAVHIGTVAVTGFPTRLVATLENVSVASEQLALRYDTDRIQVARDVQGGATTFAMPAPQTITLESGTTFRLSAAQFGGALRRRDDGTYGGFGLDIGTAELEIMELPVARVQRVEFQVEFPKGDALLPDGTRGSLRIDQFVIPTLRHGPLGDTIQQVLAAFELEGALAGVPLGPAVTAWQPAGRLDVSAGALRWGTVEASPLGGILGLDRSLRPAGSLDIVFEDPRTTFEALAVAGWVDADARAALLDTAPADPFGRKGGRPYRVSFLDGKVVLDDIEQEHTAPITLWSLPSLSPRRNANTR